MLMPIEEQCPSPIFELTKLPQELYSKDATHLTTSTDALKIAHAWSGSTIAQSIRSDVLAGFPACEFSDRSGGGLIIPAEEKY